MAQPWRPSLPEPPPSRVDPSPPSDAEPGNWFTRGGWWFFVHLLSFGLLSPVPFAHAAARSRRAGHAAAAVVSLAAVIAGMALIGGAPEDAAGNPMGLPATLGSTLMLLNLVGGLGGLIVVRAQVFGARARVAPSGRPVDPAVAGALAARERRTEARRLAADDPLLAREIRIGRPDLPRTYDDGGLVDLNTAPAATIAEVCGLGRDLAGRVVQARQAVGRFGSVEDVFAYAELPVEVWDVVRDRGVVVG